MTVTQPNFLHLGPGKSGSTWLHETLGQHPQVYLSPAKDLYFFSRFYDRRTQWYLKQFRDAPPSARVIGEVCPDYLATPKAPQRIRDTLGPDVALAVTLRDPADRAFSSYLYLSKHGLAAPTFRETMARHPELVDEGRYATQLRRYADHFGRDRIHISFFDDLQADPQRFLDGVTDFVGVDRMPLAGNELGARLPASKARFLPLAIAAHRGAALLRRFDGAAAVGWVKRSALVQRLLYRPLGSDRPVMPVEDRTRLRDLFDPEIDALEREFGVDVRRRWGWS